ncbi:rhodanese-like domain-containing protein [uncultured Mucilaginibacter sp.]|uniref:rhodanese-like domain-containing protein n=1 Tax=uncultured Mucilaginibacter sp. TaxID=797541 RepID=UPI0025D9FC25|nr:rhodanese-like domain-containing protein [uncultured Mucilaginibacter sp.]
MIATIRRLLGLKPAVDLGKLIAEGAKIIDVRSPGEFAGGHIKSSVNIPLGSPEKSFSKFKKDDVIITCCASGMRSASAKSILKSKGYTQVYNGGSWQSLKKYVQ